MTMGKPRTRRVLVTHNSIAPSAVALLNAHDIDVFFSPPYDASEVVAARMAELQPDALMVRQGRIDASVIGASSRLKVIVKHGVGVDNVDLEAAAALDIPVLRSLGSNALAVAEHAISLMLALLKQFPALDTAVKGGQWPKPSFIGRDIAGARLGLIGFGAIGRETARLAVALGMDVAVYDPHAAGEIAAAGLAVADDVEALVSDIDIVSLHCPLTRETRNIVDAGLIARMGPQTLIVNTARGGLIDEAALAAALADGRIAGAGLDSFAAEPPSPDGPLWAAPNLIVTPHVGGVTKGSAITMAETAARHIISVLDGHPPDARSLALPATLAA
ncbi:hydroxyacid dehydrogenase [Aureimonas altamirensis]|uniref:hydroxyacid dehydrogenase n=1 Tax=Aureimonas altamirensis TaxID=370622 RepID=UPI00301A210F